MAFPPAGATGAVFRARDRRRGIIWGAMTVLTIVILLVSATDSWPSLQGRGQCCREAGAVVVRLAALAPCPPRWPVNGEVYADPKAGLGDQAARPGATGGRICRYYEPKARNGVALARTASLSPEEAVQMSNALAHLDEPPHGAVCAGAAIPQPSGLGPDLVILGYPTGPDSAFKARYGCATSGDNGSYIWGLPAQGAPNPVLLIQRWAPLPGRT